MQTVHIAAISVPQMEFCAHFHCQFEIRCGQELSLILTANTNGCRSQTVLVNFIHNNTINAHYVGFVDTVAQLCHMWCVMSKQTSTGAVDTSLNSPMPPVLLMA